MAKFLGKNTKSLNVDAINKSFGGSKGGGPNGIQFFRFRMCFHQKVPTSEVDTPNGSAPPPKENPGSATDKWNVSTERIPVISLTLLTNLTI